MDAKLWKTLVSQFDPISSGPTTNQYMMARFVDFFKNSTKIYFPVHMVLFLIRIKKFKGNLAYSAIRAAKGWLKSVLFATLFAMSVPFFGTYLTKITGKPITSWHGFYVSFQFSWFILLESSSRWGEMGIWVLANWFESRIIAAKKNRYFFEIPGFAVSYPTHLNPVF